LIEVIAAIPSSLYDTNCVSPYCSYCVNQTVIYELSYISGEEYPTNIYLYGFEDICVVCEDNRLAPFCICNDG